MSMKTTIKQIYKETESYVGKEVSITGWVRTIRDSKTFGFIELNDGSFFKNLQIIFEEGKLTNFKDIAKLAISSAIIVSGILVETPGAKQPFELKADKIDIEGLCSLDYPLQKKRHTFEYLREIC